MKNSIILKVTNDKYEFILNMYESTKDMAMRLNITIKNAQQKITIPTKNKKYKYVRVWFNDEEKLNEKENIENE